MDHKIEIGAPATPERAKILDSYMRSFFKPAQLKETYDENQLNWMTRETEGLTGRTLFKMVNSLKNQVTGSADNRLTTELLERIVKQFVKQEGKGPSRRFSFFSR